MNQFIPAEQLKQSKAMQNKTEGLVTCLSSQRQQGSETSDQHDQATFIDRKQKRDTESI